MSSVVVVAVLAGLTVGCATIDYVGQNYQPTTQVDLYFSEADVHREYQVIGQVVATGDQFLSASQLQERMMAQARKAGADAVIVVSFGRKRLSDSPRVVETVTETRSEDGTKIQKETNVQQPAEGSEIRALFIRYR